MDDEDESSLSAAFAKSLGCASPVLHRPATLIGLEHEHRLSRNGRPVDFRDLIHGLAIPDRRFDPGDSNAYRLDSGLALTCDEAEAEIASPPLRLAPGFSDALVSWAAEGRHQLAALLPRDIELVGYSTHLSVSLETERQEAVLERFCPTFGPALMLLFDRPDGFGIYLRPRPGRIELCGDYFAGPELGAAAALLIGGCEPARTRPLPKTRGSCFRRFWTSSSRRRMDAMATISDARAPLASISTRPAGGQYFRFWEAARLQRRAALRRLARRARPACRRRICRGSGGIGSHSERREAHAGGGRSASR